MSNIVQTITPNIFMSNILPQYCRSNISDYTTTIVNASNIMYDSNQDSFLFKQVDSNNGSALFYNINPHSCYSIDWLQNWTFNSNQQILRFAVFDSTDALEVTFQNSNIINQSINVNYRNSSSNTYQLYSSNSTCFSNVVTQLVNLTVDNESSLILNVDNVDIFNIDLTNFYDSSNIQILSYKEGFTNGSFAFNYYNSTPSIQTSIKLSEINLNNYELFGNPIICSKNIFAMTYDNLERQAPIIALSNITYGNFAAFNVNSSNINVLGSLTAATYSNLPIASSSTRGIIIVRDALNAASATDALSANAGKLLQDRGVLTSNMSMWASNTSVYSSNYLNNFPVANGTTTGITKVIDSLTATGDFYNAASANALANLYTRLLATSNAVVFSSNVSVFSSNVAIWSSNQITTASFGSNTANWSSNEIKWYNTEPTGSDYTTLPVIYRGGPVNCGSVSIGYSNGTTASLTVNGTTRLKANGTWLSVQDNANVTLASFTRSGNNYTNMFSMGGVSITTNSNMALSLRGATFCNALDVNGAVSIGYSNIAPTSGLIVLGNCGIGTSNPNYKLDVAGNINTSGQYLIGGNALTYWRTSTGTNTTSSNILVTGTTTLANTTLSNTTITGSLSNVGYSSLCNLTVDETLYVKDAFILANLTGGIFNFGWTSNFGGTTLSNTLINGSVTHNGTLTNIASLPTLSNCWYGFSNNRVMFSMTQSNFNLPFGSAPSNIGFYGRNNNLIDHDIKPSAGWDSNAGYYVVPVTGVYRVGFHIKTRDTSTTSADFFYLKPVAISAGATRLCFNGSNKPFVPMQSDTLNGRSHHITYQAYLNANEQVCCFSSNNRSTFDTLIDTYIFSISSL